MKSNNAPTYNASVIIPVKNGEPALQTQLDALDRQIGNAKFEVIVCDNGSDDGTVKLARQHSSSRYTIRIVDASKRVGPAHARNQGALAANSEYLLFCDADDVVDSNWLEAFLEASQKWPEGVLSGRVILGGVNSPEILLAMELDSSLDIVDQEASPATDGLFGYLPLVVGGCFALSRRNYLAIGGMDESLLRVEDVDFGWRAQEAGMQVISVPRAGVHYRMRTTVKERFKQQYRGSVSNQLLYCHFRDTTMNGPSWRWAISTSVDSAVRLLRLRRNDPLRFRYAGRLGAATGLMSGMIQYRYRKIAPRRILLQINNAPQNT